MRRIFYAAALAASMSFVAAVTVRPAFPAAEPRIVFCGAGDDIWCAGTREFARQVGARVYYFHQWQAVADDLIRRRPVSVRLAGTSCGGSAAVELAKAVQKAGIRVSRLAVFDGAQVFCRTDKAPHNVARVWSTTRTAGGLGGASMRDGTRRVRETVRNDLGHVQISHDAGIRRDAVNFFVR